MRANKRLLAVPSSAAPAAAVAAHPISTTNEYHIAILPDVTACAFFPHTNAFIWDQWEGRKSVQHHTRGVGVGFGFPFA